MKLFIRFFENKEDGIPCNSNPVDWYETSLATMRAVDDWMVNYPNGKVDFINL